LRRWLRSRRLWLWFWPCLRLRLRAFYWRRRTCCRLLRRRRMLLLGRCCMLLRRGCSVRLLRGCSVRLRRSVLLGLGFAGSWLCAVFWRSGVGSRRLGCALGFRSACCRRCSRMLDLHVMLLDLRTALLLLLHGAGRLGDLRVTGDRRVLHRDLRRCAVVLNEELLPVGGGGDADIDLHLDSRGVGFV
jgi:hypothetical protein